MFLAQPYIPSPVAIIPIGTSSCCRGPSSASGRRTMRSREGAGQCCFGSMAEGGGRRVRIHADAVWPLTLCSARECPTVCIGHTAELTGSAFAEGHGRRRTSVRESAENVSCL